MVFSSITFLCYFLPLFLAGYLLINKQYRNGYILFASILFYAWGAPKFVFVLLGTTLIDFYLVRSLENTRIESRRKVILIVSLTMNLGILFVFKYANFFIENLNYLSGGKEEEQRSLALLNVVLPIGISFYTFESITYIVDVYRKVHKPLQRFRDYLLYILLFPKLIAGPIIRYHDLADQLIDRGVNDTWKMKWYGICRFVIGLSKKVIVANSVSVLADDIFASYAMRPAFDLWVGSLAYTMQIYFDFSGYSDMAIGLCAFMGFKIPENFNNPYHSQSITEFWRRWHISLGNWMRNYLYIPLGGNRNGNVRTYINLCLVFLVSGFWHGAGWNFIFWGAFHGFFLLLDRIFLENLLVKAGKWIAIPFTFLVASFGWVFFRMEDLGDALSYTQRMFSDSGESFVLSTQHSLLIGLTIAIVFVFTGLIKPLGRIINKFYNQELSVIESFFISIVSLFLLVYCISALASEDVNPFIYFRF